MSGGLCDSRVSNRRKGKVSKKVVRLTMTYGLETVALRREEEAELEVTGIKMLRLSFGVICWIELEITSITGTAKVRCLGEQVRESRFRWLGDVQRRDCEYSDR